MIATVERSELHLLSPHSAAHGTTSAREILVLALNDGGTPGFGEASPLPGYSSETLDECEDALNALLPDLISEVHPDRPDESVGALPELPAAARAAVEVALRDLAARRQAIPLWKALGATEALEVRVSHLVSATNGVELRKEIDEACDRGFSAFKLKLGRDAQQDIESIKTARDAVGADGFLAGDANCCWQLDHARAVLPTLAESGLNLIEQPVLGIEAMAQVRGIAGIATGLDEDSNSAGAFRTPKVADVCCIKLQACGGVDRMIERAIAARRVGMKVLIGSTLDGPVGITAALHAAAVIKPELHSGLATIQNIAEASDTQWIREAKMTPPQGPGLGLDWSNPQEQVR